MKIIVDSTLPFASCATLLNNGGEPVDRFVAVSWHACAAYAAALGQSLSDDSAPEPTRPPEQPELPPAPDATPPPPDPVYTLYRDGAPVADLVHVPASDILDFLTPDSDQGGDH